MVETNVETREVVAVFFAVGQLEQAIDELLGAGFSTQDLDLVVDQRAIQGSVNLSGLERRLRRPPTESSANVDNFVHPRDGNAPTSMLGGVLFVVGVTAGSALMATAGILGGALAAAAAGTVSTGAVGTLLASIIHKTDAEYFAEQLERGRWLLFVQTRTEEEEQKATRLLTPHASFEVRQVTVPAAP